MIHAAEGQLLQHSGFVPFGGNEGTPAAVCHELRALARLAVRVGLAGSYRKAFRAVYSSFVKLDVQ